MIIVVTGPSKAMDKIFYYLSIYFVNLSIFIKNKYVLLPFFWRTWGLISLFYLLSASHLEAHSSENRVLKDFSLGVNSHRVTGRDQPLLEDLGIGSPRLDLVWREVGEGDGSVDPGASALQSILNARTLIDRPLIILCYGHPSFDGGGRIVSEKGRQGFQRYALDSIAMLLPRTKLFEIWNEWDVIGMGGVPKEEGHGRVEDYVTLLKETYPVIKKAEPHSILLGGAVAGIGDRENYLPKALKLGLLDSLDGLVIHPYFYGAPEKSERIPENGLAIRLKKVKGLLSKYPKGATVPIYVTELGWPTYDQGDGVTPEVQAKFMARSIVLLAGDPQIKGVWIYELRDGGKDPDDSEQHYGLVGHDGTPKPAFWVMKDLKKILDDSQSIERSPVKASDSIVMMRLPQKNGGMRWLCWTIQPDTRWKLRISGLGKEGKARVSPLGRFGFPDGWRDHDEGADIEVSDLPVCIESSSRNLVMTPLSEVTKARKK